MSIRGCLFRSGYGVRCYQPQNITKLEIGGVTGTAYRWFESYLTGRKQFGMYKGLESDTMGLNYVVPQGSVGLQTTVEQFHYYNALS